MSLSVLEMRGLVVRCTLLRARIGQIGAFGRRVAPFAPKFRMERVSPYPPCLAWSVSGLNSAVEPPVPPHAPMDATLPFSLMSMTSVVSFSALYRIREAMF